MKVQTLRVLTILGALLVMTAATAHAQSERTEVTYIPFDFVVGKKTLPAGEYVVRPNRTRSNDVWLVQSKDGDTSALFTTTAVQSSKAAKRTKLVFNKYGDQYFLSQIWFDGSNSGRELIKRHKERELEKNIARRMVVLSDGVAVED
ncbi:MAG TPA: hypothetical protein VF074_02705 [Pyrinomonadaceae bacterium]